ncbi:hypothetical protein Afe04nite_74480 [Asanoa ferruginea]|nr:hypothetical protein Afe04nite_74480 [Asanoa ferruginea]
MPVLAVPVLAVPVLAVRVLAVRVLAVRVLAVLALARPNSCCRPRSCPVSAVATCGSLTCAALR